jgi:DNA-binding MarR family transcriptional regulator
MGSDSDRLVAAVRGVNRFYTRQIGMLRDGLLKDPFSVASARVLYELAPRNAATAAELSKELRLDPGYLMRALLLDCAQICASRGWI